MKMISKLKQAIIATDTVLKNSGKVTFDGQIEFDRKRFYYKAESFEMKTNPNRGHQRLSQRGYKFSQING